jgi:hypothetical protein
MGDLQREKNWFEAGEELGSRIGSSPIRPGSQKPVERYHVETNFARR